MDRATLSNARQALGNIRALTGREPKNVRALMREMDRLDPDAVGYTNRELADWLAMYRGKPIDQMSIFDLSAWVATADANTIFG